MLKEHDRYTHKDGTVIIEITEDNFSLPETFPENGGFEKTISKRPS